MDLCKSSLVKKQGVENQKHLSIHHRIKIRLILQMNQILFIDTMEYKDAEYYFNTGLFHCYACLHGFSHNEDRKMD